MYANSYLPTDVLQPFIKNYLIIESEHELVNRILPDTSLVLACRFKGEVNYLTGDTKVQLPSLVLSGLRKSVRLINYQKLSGNLLVIFKEGGASAFFKEPLHELFEASVSLAHFISRPVLSDLADQLLEAPGNSQRIEVMEHFLLSRLLTHTADPMVASAIRVIRASKGTNRIKELADMHCLSQDAFEKRFRRTVGSSPKLFSSIVRMKNIINNKPPLLSYTEIAFEAGFTDQSHFNKDFKLFTGLSPTDFFKAPVFW